MMCFQPGWHMDLLSFDFAKVVDDLDVYGATSRALLREGDVRRLRTSTNHLDYLYQREIVSRGQVRQKLSVHETFKEPSPFLVLRDVFQTRMVEGFSDIANLFATPLTFNTLVVQHYAPGSIGITPHRDGLSRINLVCVIVLEGNARFALCDDREGTNPRDIHAPPGHVILMRAPGYRSSDLQPFHFITDIRERRTIFGLRQRPNWLLPAS